MSLNYRHFKNRLFMAMVSFFSVLILLPLAFIMGLLIQKGVGALSFNFFLHIPKPLGEEGGGMLHALLGTGFMVILGGMIAIPWGLLGGLFLVEYPTHPLSRASRISIDILSGMPSIVIGIFAYLMLVVPFKSFSALAGGFSLALIMLPVVLKTSEEVLKLVPVSIKEAGLALGLPRYKVLFFIVIRAAKEGLLTGIILSLARASGETAPLLFTAFGNMYLNVNPLEPMASLPMQIYLYAISPYEEWHQLAWSGALVLIIVVLGLNLLARFLTSTKSRAN